MRKFLLFLSLAWFMNASAQTCSLTVSGDTTICTGQSDTLKAFASGGNGNYTYIWIPGASTNNSLVIQPSAGVYAYTVTATDGIGCISTATINIKVNALPTASLQITSPSCGDALPDYGTQGKIKVIASGASPFTYYWYDGGILSTIDSIPTGFIIDSVKVIDTNGCATTLQYTLTQPLPISITFLPHDSVFCVNNCYGITYTISGGTAPYQIYWMGDPNQPFTTSSYVNLCPTMVGEIIDYQIWDANGCGVGVILKPFATVVDCSVGIDKVKKEDNGIQIYPNPISSIINIVVGTNSSENKVQITDVLGNEVMQLLLQNEKASIDISSLTNGFYFIHLGNSTQKFIKQ